MTMEKGGKVINNMTIPKNRMERKKCDIYIPVLPCIQQTTKCSQSSSIRPFSSCCFHFSYFVSSSSFLL